MNNAIQVGTNIRERRSSLNMTQSELAYAANISQTQLSAYETGKQLPGLVTMANIANALDTTIDHLCFKGFIEGASDPRSTYGETVVACIARLFEEGLCTHILISEPDTEDLGYYVPSSYYLEINQYERHIERLITLLNDYQNKIDTFTNPKQHRQQILQSVSKDIDNAKNLALCLEDSA